MFKIFKKTALISLAMLFAVSLSLADSGTKTQTKKKEKEKTKQEQILEKGFYKLKDGTYELDIDNDGKKDIQIKIASFDNGAVTDLFYYTFEYNKAGKVKRKRWQLYRNMHLWDQRIIDYQYPSKNEIKELHDIDADGNPDVEWLSTFDDNGNEIRSTRDNGLDGKIDWVWEASYNDKKELEKVLVDENADGILDQEWYRGEKIVERYDTDKDGKLDVEIVTIWDEKENSMEKTEDRGLDGKIDYWFSAFYNSNDLPTKIMLDEDGDGNINFLADYVYLDENKDGKTDKTIETINLDENDDGKMDKQITTEYGPGWKVIRSEEKKL